MTGRQVVYTGQDDRVQDDDLAQKDDFHFGTHGSEEMPTSAIDVTLLARTPSSSSCSSMMVDTAVGSSVIV